MPDATIPSTRRDRRFPLPFDRSRIEFREPDSGAPVVGSVFQASPSGLAFECEGHLERYPVGTCLDQVTIVVGPCIFRGEASVRNCHIASEDRVELGCLFYASIEDEELWATFIAGIQIGMDAAEEPV